MIDWLPTLFSGESDSKIAKRLGVATSTVGRWKKDLDKVPFDMIQRQALSRGYKIQIVRKERVYDF